MKKDINFNGSTISYAIEGTGLPVMLVHGFGEESRVWDQQVAFLSDKFQLIVPELPGTGNSAAISDMSMSGMADTLKAIVDKESITHFVLIGHSMGGYVSLAFAEKFPSLLTGLGLFHSSAYADSEEKKATRKKGISFIREHGAFAFLKNTSPNLFSPATTGENPGLIDEFIAGLGNFSPASLVSYYEAMMARPDRSSVLKDSKIPVLFVIGEHDNAIPSEDMLKQSHMPEKAYIHILHQSGHMGMLEETNKTNSILEDYLSNL